MIKANEFSLSNIEYSLCEIIKGTINFVNE